MFEQEKPVSIPERVKPKNPIEAPEFVRFYMGKRPPAMDHGAAVHEL